MIKTELAAGSISVKATTSNKIKKKVFHNYSIFSLQSSLIRGVIKMSVELKQNLNELKIKLEHLRSYL